MINRENVPWLVQHLGKRFDYDMVVIDELSSFKNWQAKRFRALMAVRPLVKRIVGLTGTPSPNGYMDLFAEYRLLSLFISSSPILVPSFHDINLFLIHSISTASKRKR